MNPRRLGWNRILTHLLRAYVHRFVPLTGAEWTPLAAALCPCRLPRHVHFVGVGPTRAEVALVLSGALRLCYLRVTGLEKPGRRVCLLRFH